MNFHIVAAGMIIESVSHCKSLAEAKKYAKKRYGSTVPVEVAKDTREDVEAAKQRSLKK